MAVLIKFLIKENMLHAELALEDSERNHVVLFDGNKYHELRKGNGTYDVDTEIVKRENIAFFIRNSEGETQSVELRFARFVPLADEVFLYSVMEGRYVFWDKKEQAIRIRPVSPGWGIFLFVKHLLSYMGRGIPGMKALVARGVYRIARGFKKKQIWLLLDRTNRADDNGEVMFCYLSEHPRENVKTYFVIDKETEDAGRMGAFGETVQPFSFRHKVLFLLQDLVLSSHGNKPVTNPFGGLEYLYRDYMYDKKIVLLQHGVTKDDQSAWLNRCDRNLFGLVVTTNPEYDSMFEYDYFYNPEHIWLTGMPRYDRLYRAEKSFITIMPTWRKTLSPGADSKGTWLLSEEFADSGYVRCYNELLNDEELIEAAEKYGYQLCFMPHPNTWAGIQHFKKHPKVRFFEPETSYRDVFAWSDLMVTDYSSVAFDFAYLRKPVVYYQFDKDEFFGGGHTYAKGYFDYERDGFGEVEDSLQGLRGRLIQYMSEGCRLKELYEARIENTFPFDDSNCCRRVCDKLDELL